MKERTEHHSSFISDMRKKMRDKKKNVKKKISQGGKLFGGLGPFTIWVLPGKATYLLFPFSI